MSVCLCLNFSVYRTSLGCKCAVGGLVVIVYTVPKIIRKQWQTVALFSLGSYLVNYLLTVFANSFCAPG